MDLGQIPEPVLEEQMWQTLDQEILPLTTTTSTDMGITSLACVEMSSQANIGKELYPLGSDQDVQNIAADVTGCAEHLISPVDDASVFQNLKHLICDSESTQERALMVASTSPENHSDPAEKIPFTLCPLSPHSGKDMTQLQQQDSLMEFFNLSTGHMDHFEEFYDLNLLLEQVAAHDVELNAPVGDELSPTVAPGGVESSASSSLSEQVPESSSSPPPTKKLKTLSVGVNEDIGEVSSTQTGKSNLTLETTHQKYMEMRRKNNIASRRSRQIRKEKDKAMEAMANELEKENRVLKERAEKLEKQRDALKNYLMTLITKPVT